MTAEQLPLFEGHKVVTTELSVKGSKFHVDNQVPRALKPNERVVMVVVGTVDPKFVHEETEGGWVRGQTVTLSEAYEITDSDAASVILDELREETREVLDARLGRLREAS